MVYLDDVPLGVDLREALESWADGIWDAYEPGAVSHEKENWMNGGSACSG